jgi:hypothetical protein
MPGRALFYKFLNTIIDDLFSFIITMPTMHRISCFRDDAVFIVYLYQRWVYTVDKSRGQYALEPKEGDKKAKSSKLNKKIEDVKEKQENETEVSSK